ncbi:MAG: threonine synthase [Pseudomonadota bacterium]
MKYISTRGTAPILGFEDVLLTGLASDGGLYVPENWPQVSPAAIAGFAGKPYRDVAIEVIWPYTGGAIARADFEEMVSAAYTAFEHPAVTPLVQIAENRWVLELFHGPTLAFKDIAMQLLALIMDYILARRAEHSTIVVATSGDTGGAAVEAFRGRERIDLVILYPAGRVSDVQRRMMTTTGEANIHALEVDGTFDDCQALVKAMFTDCNFRDTVKLSGVNSINWARIVPQITYYFYAAANLGAPYRPVSFTVPTGNFGDIFAGYAAQRMNLAVEKLIIASNDNDILPRTLASGIYEKRAVKATTSPSMDIQVSSNFERLLFEVQSRDAARVRAQMASLAQSGRFEVVGGAHILQKIFAATTANESDVARSIRQTMATSGYILDPHTACGVFAAEQNPSAGSAADVVLATAHPAKFPDAMREIAGHNAELPTRLAHLMTAKEHTTPIANDLSAVQGYIRSHSRVLR